ncbi:hypothetical protein N7495_007420 [Penicillium taxi]|uniref:uncharacterized protein n=1 Tax=Penicillium taxi TaxID=168475 RepID=UPI002545952F|nr:uncharacterized protein N7495_007420 [Penicillium taxi]KAJ5887379.1 hypothetical protein N7495_007420 [Penicillium taxi]
MEGDLEDSDTDSSEDKANHLRKIDIKKEDIEEALKKRVVCVLPHFSSDISRGRKLATVPLPSSLIPVLNAAKPFYLYNLNLPKLTEL